MFFCRTTCLKLGKAFSIGRMNKGYTIFLLLLLLAYLGKSASFDYIKFNIPHNFPEKVWRDALAKAFDGQVEVNILGGRIDVETESEVFELDFIHKWHEGLGQALHYADVTGMEGVLALISQQPLEKLFPKDLAQLDLIICICARHDIQVIVLFPL